MKAKNIYCAAFALIFIVRTICHGATSDPMSHDELLRRAHDLLKGVAAGDNAAWQKYFAEDCLFFDEKGRSFEKAALMKEIGALPDGYQVSFRIENTQSRILPDTAVFSYDVDEDLKIYGQQLGAKFHTTDTWVRRQGKWEIIATQSFRYYGDPAPGDVDRAEFGKYTGTYELAPGVRAVVSLEGGELYYQRGSGPKEQLIPEAPRIFFRKGVEGRMLFRYDKDGEIDALISRRNHEDITWRRVG